jgi:SEC-C motif-containing protein
MATKVESTAPCPCTSGRTYGECCEPFINKKSYPPTAEALMRSRYSAYAVGNVDYVMETDDPNNGGEFDRASADTWSSKSEWTGLEVVEIIKGGANDTTGIVEFIARFKIGGKEMSHKERSNFRKVEGKWCYVDGETPIQKPFVKETPTLGRNDPCHCGSGKKFKKCHGA